MSGLPTTSVVGEEEAPSTKEDMSLEQKIGMAKKFDREMKDYAKATVKEFLGIYGYEEDVDINMDDSETHKASTTNANENRSQDENPSESESSTSADNDNRGNKTLQEMAGIIQARTAVVTIDLESYDENEVSETLLANVEGTSRPDCGRSEMNPGSCLSDEVLPCSTVTDTLISEVGTPGLQVEPQSPFVIGSQKDTQCELGLHRDMLESQRELQSHSEICGSQREVETPGETLGSEGELQPINELHGLSGEEGAPSEACGLQRELQPQSGIVQSQNELRRVDERLESPGKEQSHNELPESQARLGKLNETIEERSEFDTQDEDSQSQDDVEAALHEVLEPQQELHLHGLESHNRILSQTFVPTNELNLPYERPRFEAGDERTASGVGTFESEDETLGLKRLSVTLGQSMETLELATGSLEMPQGETESTPTASEILEAISQIIPRSQATGQLAVLQEHSYSTTGRALSDANPVPGVCSSVLDSISNDEAHENQHSNDMTADNSNVECNEPSPSDCDKELSLSSSDQPSPIKASGSCEDVHLSSRDESNLPQGLNDISSVVDSTVGAGQIAPAHISPTNPDTNISLTPMQAPNNLSISNSSLEAVESGNVESFLVRESDCISSSDSGVISGIGSNQIAAVDTSASTPCLSMEVLSMIPPVSKSNVQSREVESNETQSSSGISSRVAPSMRCSQVAPANISADIPGITSNIELPPMQSSISNSDLENVQFTALSGSPADLTPKEKSRLTMKKSRANETAEKREERLKLQRERTRIRRSQESEAEREARREKDRKRQQLKRANLMKQQGGGDLLDETSHVSPSTEVLVDDGKVGERRSTLKHGAMAISESTDSIPHKKAKTSEDLGSYNILVSSEGVEVTGGERFSTHECSNRQNVATQLHKSSTTQTPGASSDVSATSEDRDTTGESEMDVLEHNQIPPDDKEDTSCYTGTSGSDSSDVRTDRDVTTSATTRDNYDDPAIHEGKDLTDEHRRDGLEHNQIPSEDPALQTTSALVSSDVRADTDVPSASSSTQISQDSYDGPAIQESEYRDDTECNQIPSGSSEATASETPTGTFKIPVPNADDNIDDRNDSSMLAETSLGKPQDSLAERPGDESEDSASKDTSKLSKREKSRLHMRKRRAMESPEEREARLRGQRERVRERRANESQTARDIRRVRDRIRQRILRTSESAEVRGKRLLQQRDATRRRRASESPEEKQARRVKDRDRARKSRESKRAGVVMEWW